MKRLPEHPPNHDRWIISYADFVTLMFALFVAMYAMSLKDRDSGKKVSESVKEAFGQGVVTSASRSVVETPLPLENIVADARQLKSDNDGPTESSLQEAFNKLGVELKGQIDA